MLLAICGSTAGLGFAILAIRNPQAFGLDRLPRFQEIAIGADAAFYALLLSVLTGLGITAGQAIWILRGKISGTLLESGRTLTAGRRAGAVRKVLVAAQVAFAFILITGAGLALASFRSLLAADPGFVTAGVVTASVTAPRTAYASAQDLSSLLERCLRAIRALPGVTAAGVTTGIPLAPPYEDSVLLAEGHRMRSGESVIAPARLIVSPGYFETMKIALVEGRYFSDGDTSTSEHVAIIDEQLGKRFWPGQSAVGKRIFMPQSPGQTEPNAHTPLFRVVGVVRTVLLQDLTGKSLHEGVYYFSTGQVPPRTFTFAVRGAAISDVRAAIAQVDPGLALFDVRRWRSEHHTHCPGVAMQCNSRPCSGCRPCCLQRPASTEYLLIS